MLKITRVFATCCLATLVACGDDGGPGVVDAPKTPHDAAVDAPGGHPDADCFPNPDPSSHVQIINACTTATKIYKDSHPPMLGSGGSLPPLP